jgi:hypothetical protein
MCIDVWLFQPINICLCWRIYVGINGLNKCISVDTGGNFAIGINNTSKIGGKILPPVSLTLVANLAGVLDIGGALCEYLREFVKK